MKLNKLRCPVCKCPYTQKKDRHKTRHHILPRVWYGKGKTVAICNICHQEFNAINPIPNEWVDIWTVKECYERLIMFCRTKGMSKKDIVRYLREGSN